MFNFKSVHMKNMKNVVFTDRSANSVDILFKDIRKYDVLSDEEQDDLLECISKGNECARVKLINSNLRMVVSKAKQYAWCGMAQEDLFQVGFMGLIEAVNRFDPSKCTVKCAGFRAYALHWIDGELMKATKEHTRNTPKISIEGMAFTNEDRDISVEETISSGCEDHADWNIRYEQAMQKMKAEVEKVFCKEAADFWEDCIEMKELGYTMTDVAKKYHLTTEYAERRLDSIQQMLRESYQDQIADRPLLYHRLAS